MPPRNISFSFFRRDSSRSAGVALCLGWLFCAEISAAQSEPTTPPAPEPEPQEDLSPQESQDQPPPAEETPTDKEQSQDSEGDPPPAEEEQKEGPQEEPSSEAQAGEAQSGKAATEDNPFLNADESDTDDDEELEFEAVAEVAAPPREATKHTIEQEQLTRIAGTRGDALRAVEILPGVGRSNFGANEDAPILRGSSPWESIVVLDGAEVPIMYHFGGLTSFFNSHLLEEVNLYPGNYSARYGRAAGGVVEARVRDPLAEGFHALLEVSAIDSFALVEGGLTKNTSLALAARRSNIDLFYSALVPEGAYTVLAAPVYYDYQAILAHRFSEAHKLRILAFGSHDRMEFYLDDSAPDDPALRGQVDASIGFHRAQVELDSKFSEILSHKLMLSTGPSSSRQKLGPLDAAFNFWDLNARSDWTINAAKWARIDTGLDFQMFGGTGRYIGPAPSPSEGETDTGAFAGESFVSIEETGVTPVRPAAFIEASLRPTEDLLLVPGVRADYVAEGGDWTVDPRLSARYAVSEASTVKGGIGYYSQAPEYYEILDEIGNPDAKPFRTLQTSAGFEQALSSQVSLDMEGFYKLWQDRLVGTEGGVAPHVENGGKGRAYGLEMLLQVRLSAKTQAFASYTLSRSQRKDHEGESWRLFDYDQTHNLSLTANYDLGKGWLAGARFRLVSGNPYSAVQGAVYDASSDTYRPLFSDVNQERSPVFHQLDLRVEKLWALGPVGLTTFLEVMNVYNSTNQDGYGYSFDYSESEAAPGMPFFPNLGIRGEL